MIILKSLTLKNFLSTGAQTQSVDFTRDHLTLILGENRDASGEDNGRRNASGKSVILNAISYVLFGQSASSIKKDNLINFINKKNMLVTLNFEKNGVNYRIERGRRPAVLKFFINDIEQAAEEDTSQGDSRETQKSLDNFIGMDYDLFKHIVALNTYTEPFLSMSANNQRIIIEQLLGITLLSEKAESLRAAIKTVKEDIIKETANIEAIKRSNDKINQSIESLKIKQRAWARQNTQDINQITSAIIELKDIDVDQELNNHALLKQYNENTVLINNLIKERTVLEKAILQASRNYQKYLDDLESLKGGHCHTCGQSLQNDKHEELYNKTLASLDESQDCFNKLQCELDNINDKLDKIEKITKPTVYYSSIEEVYKHQNNVHSLEQQLLTRANELDPYQEQIDELTASAIQEINWTTINDLTSLQDHQEFLLKLLTNKDSFIRKRIIDQNLSYLNTRLTYYLDYLGLPHQVKFLNDLSVDISLLGQSLDHGNLSRGEGTRLMLGLSLAFRDTWENLYQPINLLFVDESLDNGLDTAGVENALAILKKTARDRKKNVFLISHKEELVGRVNTVLKAVKENHFTSYHLPDA